MITETNMITLTDLFKLPRYDGNNCLTMELKCNINFNAYLTVCSNEGILISDVDTLDKIKKGILDKKIYHIEIKSFLKHPGSGALKHNDTNFTKAFPDENTFVILDMLYSEIIRKNQQHNLDLKKDSSLPI